jgi:NAD(P)-dependent dehydrogenase (short-subunit alcohol dehydrogenase family)
MYGPEPRARRFAGKVAIVTGGASGIGYATALWLGVEGACVVLADREDGHEAADRLQQAGVADVLACTCDVSDPAQVVATTQAAIQHFGGFDVVVNNAGRMIFKPIEEHTEADFLDVLRVNLLGAFFFTQQAFLAGRRPGAIVNVASIHALQTSPLVSAYAAAKAGLLSLTRSAAIEGKAKGIRVNAVVPGAIETRMLRDNPNLRSGVEALDEAAVGHPEDVAAAIAYLASDEAAFIDGTCLRVDGGRLNRL